MSNELLIDCPQCDGICGINIACGDLEEGHTTEDVIIECLNCYASFTFDICVAIMNKKIIEE